MKKGKRSDKEATKHRLLSHPSPSFSTSIANAVVVKDQGLFFLSEPTGAVPKDHSHGLGLYYRDCRYLNRYEMEIAGEKPALLGFTAAAGFLARFQLTNPALHPENGDKLGRHKLAIRWERFIDSSKNEINETLTFTNYTQRTVQLPVRLIIEARFEDIYSVRGLLPHHFGTHLEPVWKNNHLVFTYKGRDRITRRITFSLSTPAERTDDGVAFKIRVPKEGQAQVLITFTVQEGKSLRPSKLRTQRSGQRERAQQKIHRSCQKWLCEETRVESDSLAFNSVLGRCLRDLRVLRDKMHGRHFFSAGLPWFATLFGRDSLISSLQTLAFNPGIARDVLLLLAKYQGRKVDEWTEEQPGKILHVLRFDEFANLREIPHSPFYGTVDATPLFAVLLHEYVSWTGDLALLDQLEDPINLALKWVENYSDSDGDGYADYDSIVGDAIINHGWKDSGDAVIDRQGKIATPPIALVEVQGYVYMAKQALAALFSRRGSQRIAQKLSREAADLKKRFNKDFWMAKEKFFALGLQSRKRKLEVISSNPGHALWSGIVDDDKIEPVVKRLMKQDMFTGWGIRTLASSEKGYSPIAYHRGTVWPHDNSIIAAGFKRYGYEQEVLKIFNGIVEAALNFEDFRLPELYCGYSQEEFREPVRYPVACHPQAWAAASIPFLMQSMLGLVPNALENRLRIVNPVLPEFIRQLDLCGLRVGQAKLDLRFQRGAGDVLGFRVLRTSRPIEVVMENSTR